MPPTRYTFDDLVQAEIVARGTARAPAPPVSVPGVVSAVAGAGGAPGGAASPTGPGGLDLGQISSLLREVNTLLSTVRAMQGGGGPAMSSDGLPAPGAGSPPGAPAGGAGTNQRPGAPAGGAGTNQRSGAGSPPGAPVAAATPAPDPAGMYDGILGAIKSIQTAAGDLRLSEVIEFMEGNRATVEGLIATQAAHMLGGDPDP